MNEIIKFRDLQDLTSPPIISNHLFSINSGADTTGKYFFATAENNSFNFCYGNVTGNLKNHFFNFHNFVNKERLYITAISNLYKKIDYLQLTIQLDQDLINVDEFDFEIETYENRYLISSNDNFKEEEFDIAVSIANKITQRDFTSDELAEMFSIPLERVNELLYSFEIKSNKNLNHKY